MNAQRLLDAMEHISDTYILHAQAISWRPPNPSAAP